LRKVKKTFMGFIEQYPKLASLFLGSFFTVVMFFCVEKGFDFYYAFILPKLNPNIRASQHSGTYTNPKFFIQPDPNLGYRPRANVTVTSKRQFVDGEVIYDVTYSTDSFNRRIVPVDSLENRNKFILTFGCSFTFGEGVNDDQTLAYNLGKNLEGFMPYNYGFCGYGPQQMLAKLQSGDLIDEIDQPQGIALVIGAHFERAIGTMSVFNGWGRNFPYYIIDKEDSIIRKGTFTSGRPVLSFLYKAYGKTIAKTSIARALKLRDYTFRITENHVRLTARIISESQNIFLKTFQNSDFYFVTFPGNTDPNRKLLVKLLEKSGVKCLNYIPEKKFSVSIGDIYSLKKEYFPGKEYYIYGDGHPTPKWHREFAELIVKDLDSEGQTNKQNVSLN